MSFVLLGTLAINCTGELHLGALLAAPFLYNAYGQNLYVNEFNWWFRLFTFILIFVCNGTGLYGILKFKVGVCKITSYVSCAVWFFVLLIMMFGSRNASIVALRSSMSVAALEGKALDCATSWSGMCYLLGLSLLLNFQAAAAYFMQTLVIIPVKDATDGDETPEINRSTESEVQLTNFKQPELKIKSETPIKPLDKDKDLSLSALYPKTSKIVPGTESSSSKVILLNPLPPANEEQPEERRPSFAVSKQVSINQLTVKSFKPKTSGVRAFPDRSQYEK